LAELPLHKGTPGWEFTPLPKGFDLDAYPTAAGAADTAQTPQPVFAPEDAVTITQVDHAWNRAEAAADGPIVMPLSQAVEQHGDLVERHLGKVGANDAFVYVPRGVKVEAPILLTSVLASQDASLHWRVLVVLEEGAEAEVWEQYLSSADGLFTTVVELVVGDNANLRFLSAQDLSEQSLVFGTQRARVGRAGALDWVVLGFGSANGKVFQNTILDGEGATGKVTGAYVTRNRQHLDFDTTQEHAAEDTTSDLAFRGVLGDRATAVWRGMIRVDPGAQRTDAFQESRNLLLSTQAHADAIPGLEIEADDVRCTHAAAVAQVDPDQLYYLRSHGLPEPEAKRLVIEGFLQELVQRAHEGPIRETLRDELEKRLEVLLG